MKMPRVLVLLPDEFNCLSKFERKMRRITQSFQEYSVIYPRDENGLIKRYFDGMSHVETIEEFHWDLDTITHAIVFDDGEVFPEERRQLHHRAIPTRLINIKITRVVNIKIETRFQGLRSSPDYEYIGRGSYWGNPYAMHEDGDDRGEVIRKFKYDFEYHKFPNIERNEVYALAGKRLGCFCKPAACHGDVLAEYLNSWDDGN